MMHVNTMQSMCQVPPLQLHQGLCKATVQSYDLQIIRCKRADCFLRDRLGKLSAAHQHLHVCSAAGPSGAHRQQLSSHTRLLASTEAHTQHLAQLLAADTRQGDCICLHGDVGAGKSFFSREFIRSAYDEPDLPVPSPTYLLQNIYDDLEGPPIHHFDLYRLNGALDLQRIGWARSLQTAVCLVEWPDVLGDHLPSERLDIRIDVADEGLAPEQHGAAGSTPASEHGVGGHFEDTEPRVISLEYSSSWSDRMAQTLHSLQEQSDLMWRLLP